MFYLFLEGKYVVEETRHTHQNRPFISRSKSLDQRTPENTTTAKEREIQQARINTCKDLKS